MKLWLIKLGKVVATVQRDGIMAGVQKAAAGLSATLKMMWVPAGDILIVTSGIGDSARYRAHHVAEELRLAGFRVSVTVQDNPFLSFFAQKFSVIIFHRALYLGATRKLYDRAKRLRKTIIFETDDLVYDPAYLKDMDYWQQMSALEQFQYKNGVGGEMVSDTYVAVATTTTTFLADKLRARDKQVFIITNKLSVEDIIWASSAYRQHQDRFITQSAATAETTEQLVIGYFSGTLSHNKDFATITPALIQILRKYPQVRIAIFGPLDLDNNLRKFADRFIQYSYVARNAYFGKVASVDIAVAPLELDNPFCQSKSELKFFEAGIVGVPVVAVANQTFSEAITDGVDGFVASTTDEWVEKLSRLIDEADLRKTIGDAARDTALACYTTQNAHSNDYYEFLRSKIQKI